MESKIEPCYFVKCGESFSDLKDLYVHLTECHPNLLYTINSLQVLHKDPILQQFFYGCDPQSTEFNDKPDLTQALQQYKDRKYAVEDYYSLNYFGNIIQRFNCQGPFKQKAVYDLILDELMISIKGRSKNFNTDKETQDYFKHSLQYFPIEDAQEIIRVLQQCGFNPAESVFAELASNHGVLPFAVALQFKTRTLVNCMFEQNYQQLNKLLVSFKFKYSHDPEISQSLMKIILNYETSSDKIKLHLPGGHQVTHMFVNMYGLNDNFQKNLIALINKSPSLQYVIMDKEAYENNESDLREHTVVHQLNRKITLCCPDDKEEFCVVKLLKKVVDLKGKSQLDKLSQVEKNVKEEKGFNNSELQSQFQQQQQPPKNNPQNQSEQLLGKDDNLKSKVNKSTMDECYANLEKARSSIVDSVPLLKDIQICQEHVEQNKAILKFLTDTLRQRQIEESFYEHELQDSNYEVTLPQRNLKGLINSVGSSVYEQATPFQQNKLKAYYKLKQETQDQVQKEANPLLLKYVDFYLRSSTREQRIDQCEFWKTKQEMANQGIEIIQLIHRNEYTRVYKCQPMSEAIAKKYNLQKKEYAIRIPSETDMGETKVEFDTIKKMRSLLISKFAIEPVHITTYFGQQVMITNLFEKTLAHNYQEIQNAKEFKLFIQQICQQLIWCHEKKIYHLGLSPDSIYIGPQNTPLIADWGNSKNILCGGKFGYQPPEFFTPEARNPWTEVALDKVDSYSLGLVLDFCVNGESKLELDDIYQMEKTGRVPDWFDQCFEDGKPISKIIKSLTRQNPAERQSIVKLNLNMLVK